MKIWIRGAGDLATGIASRLYRSGHQLLMTELPGAFDRAKDSSVVKSSI